MYLNGLVYGFTICSVPRKELKYVTALTNQPKEMKRKK